MPKSTTQCPIGGCVFCTVFSVTRANGIHTIEECVNCPVARTQFYPAPPPLCEGCAE